MKTFIVLFIAICAQTLGDVFLTKGMKSIGEVKTLDPVELFNIGLQVFTNPLIWLGIILLGIFFGLYLVALSWADLSFVLPVTSFGYAMNAFLSWRLLGEHVAPARGMRKVGDVSFRPRALMGALGRMIRSPYLFGGVACLAVAFFSFISLLSYADLSFVAPLTAVTYITNTLGARFFLKERISKSRWMGTILVATGVGVISLDKHIEVFFKTRAIGLSGLIYSELAPDEMVNQAAEPVAFWALFALRAALLACAAAAIVYYLIAFVAGLLWFADRRRQRALGLDYTPPATIFKPVRGADAEAYENFASFLRQDYPEYQIIFGLREESDPAAPIIRRLIADFPERDVELVISSGEFGHNAKVSNLQNMYAKAKHDVLLIADSDIRVRPDYLRRVVAPLRPQGGAQTGAPVGRPQVGMVTCLYR